MYWKFQKLNKNFDFFPQNISLSYIETRQKPETQQGKTRNRLKKDKNRTQTCLNPSRSRTRLFETHYITRLLLSVFKKYINFSALCIYGSRNLQMFYSQSKRFNCLTKIFHLWWRLLHWFHYRTNIQWNCLSTGWGIVWIIKNISNKNTSFFAKKICRCKFLQGYYKWNVKHILYTAPIHEIRSGRKKTALMTK